MAYDSILKALTGDAEQDLASNPWYTGGREMSAMDPTNPYEPAWKNILAKSLLGFGSGLGQGFGKRQAENQATERQTAVLSALSDTDPNAAFTKLSLESPSYNKYASLYGIEDANSKAELRKKMNDLRLTTRYNKFIDVDPSGKVMELPGAGDALASIEGKQELSRSEAKNQSDLKFKPQLEGAITGAKLREELKYTPQIEAAKNSALVNKPLTQKEIKDAEVRTRNDIAGSQPFKNVFAIKPILDSMKKSLDDPSGAGDLDYFYGTAKVLDPGSVVLAGELKLTQDIDSKTAQLLKSAEKMVLATGRLDPTIKQQLYNLAERRYVAHLDSYKTYARPIIEAEERSGGKRENMLILPLDDKAKDLSRLSELSNDELKALQKELELEG